VKLQTCRRHPAAAPFLATCSGCTQELYDLEVANRKAAAAALAAKVRAFLGLPVTYPAPRPDFDETETRVSVWDVRQINDVYTHVGGTVTAREVECTLSDDTTYTVIRVTVTVDLAGVGEVEVFTDWDPTDEAHGFALPVIVDLNRVPAAV
jgi:hypothetical protein